MKCDHNTRLGWGLGIEVGNLDGSMRRGWYRNVTYRDDVYGWKLIVLKNTALPLRFMSHSITRWLFDTRSS